MLRCVGQDALHIGSATLSIEERSCVWLYEINTREDHENSGYATANNRNK